MAAAKRVTRMQGSDFLAALAHELRGALGPLGNMLEIMKRAEGNRELVQQACGTMERQASQLVRLVDDLLDVGRLEENGLELRKERVDLTSIVRRVVDASRAWSAGVEHRVTVEAPEEPVWLDADPARLAQVFFHLFDNARKYTEPTGQIWVTVESASDHVVVTVRDSGAGIPADRLEGIFETYARTGRSRERNEGGLGIGLTLVRRLVELHGGSVTAASEGAGRGSAFTVRLPVTARKEQRPPSAPAEETARASAPLRFLVVDDDPDSTASLAMLLSIEGHEARTARDGLEALALPYEFHPDVVLLDIGLPKIDGYETARRMRQDARWRDVVLIALTGWDQEEDRRKSKEAGFNGHMVKPVEFDALMKLLGPLTSRRTVA